MDAVPRLNGWYVIIFNGIREQQQRQLATNWRDESNKNIEQDAEPINGQF
jgi:hypothetical protein